MNSLVRNEQYEQLSSSYKSAQQGYKSTLSLSESKYQQLQSLFEQNRMDLSKIKNDHQQLSLSLETVHGHQDQWEKERQSFKEEILELQESLNQQEKHYKEKEVMDNSFMDSLYGNYKCSNGRHSSSPFGPMNMTLYSCWKKKMYFVSLDSHLEKY